MRTGIKVAFVGAGSTVFSKSLIGDLLSFPELADGATLALMDIDAERLRTSELVARQIVGTLGVNTRVEATLDEYERVRADGTRFLLRPGHVDARVERVVEQRSGRFTIVEKFNTAIARMVRKLDPRTESA